MHQIWAQWICKERPLDAALEAGSRATPVAGRGNKVWGLLLELGVMIDRFGSQCKGWV
jgi:hypothetical protein